MSDEQTLEGARNRVLALSHHLEADLIVSIEGGVGPAHLQRPGSLECFAWVCALDPVTGAESTARSPAFVLPGALAALLQEGLELGRADDRLFGRRNSGKGSGTIGRLSNGVLDRTEFHVDAVVCCLVPFMQPHLYGSEYGRFSGPVGEAVEAVAGNVAVAVGGGSNGTDRTNGVGSAA